MAGMRALTLTQPAEHLAYLSGVVHGDGWCTRVLGLRVADEDFARQFATSICSAFGVTTNAARDERGYWLVRISNKTGRFDVLRDFEPTAGRQCAAWVRGLFDSEGNARLWRLPSASANAFGRRVAMFSTRVETLQQAQGCLDALAIPTRLSGWQAGAGHKGAKPVHVLEVRGGQVNYMRFAELVGSSIARKQHVLDEIPASYQPPGHHRRMQAAGVAVRNARRAAGGRY